MTRLWIFSDLHIEQSLWKMSDVPGAIDVIVAAGDIHSPTTRSVEWVAEMAAGIPIVFVPGNHEWYAPRWPFGVDQETARAQRAAAKLGVHMLMDNEIEIAGARFLGSTLWTDFAIHGTPDASMSFAARGMNDFRYIYPTDDGRHLRPEDTVEWHRSSRAWLEARLADPPTLPTVVVTHHLPHPRSIAPIYVGDALTPAFASDLSHLVENGGASLWVHGHTHTGCDYVAGRTRVVCNPKGYGPAMSGGRIENPAFDLNLVVDV